MNKRQRKKYLKQKGLYVSRSELWDLDYTITKWIIPRLKAFKKSSTTYPDIDKKLYFETGEIKRITFEDWQNILEEIIVAFEQVNIDPMDIAIREKIVFKNKLDNKNYENICKQRQEKIERGLDLFKYYIQDLWW